MVWFGVVWWWYGVCGLLWCGVVNIVWCGVVWCGMVWCGVVWFGGGMVWCGVSRERAWPCLVESLEAGGPQGGPRRPRALQAGARALQAGARALQAGAIAGLCHVCF